MDEFDVVVLGSGPGGYVAAIRAAQLGLTVALVEKADLGGVCLNWGCIPSKTLIHSADVLDLIHRSEEFGITIQGVQADLAKAVTRSRKVVDRMVKGVAFLMRKNKITVVHGEGVLTSPTELEVGPDGRRLRAKNIILATGARPRQIPGMVIDGETVLGSYEAVQLATLPQSVVIVGAGAVGLEFGHIWSSYGARVTIVEALPRVLPLEDEEISQSVERTLARRGMTFITGAPVRGIEVRDGKAIVHITKNDIEQSLDAEKVLVAIGVQGNSDGIGLEGIGVRVERSWTPVDQAMRTNVPGIYAIGDLTGPPLLAHVASAQGVAAAEHIAGRNPPPLDYDQMPRATYCHPEVASIGLTETQARERGINVQTGSFPFRPNGRALSVAEPDGLVKVVADGATGEIVGVHMFGPQVSELLGEASLARTLESTVGEVGFAVHAHPTLSEVLKEAALAVRGEAIHI